MLGVSIYIYNPKNQINQFEIYVLCKGLNSGKPLEMPCPNCFVITCKSNEEKYFYWTLLYGLWEIKHFEQFLVGSVIPFLRISEFKKIIEEQAIIVSNDPGDFKNDIEKVRKIEARQKQIYEQMLLLNDIKKALIYRHFKRRAIY